MAEKEDIKSVSDSFCGPEKYFASKTTCGGVSYWCGGIHKTQKFAWVIIVLGLTAGLAFQVFLRISAYLSYAATRQTTVKFTSEIEFPAVTICNFNRYFGLISAREVSAVHTLNRLTSPQVYSDLANSSTGFDSSPLSYFNDSFSVTSYLTQKGYPLDSSPILIHCMFQSKPCTAADFTPVITRMGKCYTFNKSRSIQNVAGSGQGLLFILIVLHSLYTEEPLHGEIEAGIRFQLHSKFEPPEVHKYGVGIPTGMKAFSTIQRTETSLVESPWGKCNPGTQRNLKYFDTYTLSSCVQECFTDHLVERCGCRTFEQYWASDVPECSIEQMLNCSTAYVAEMERTLTPDSCSCNLPCKFTTYGVTTSYATAPNFPTRNAIQTLIHNNDVAFVGDNFVGLDISYAVIGYTKVEQFKAIDESALLSDIGGQLGLWLGMSFVTLLELFQYVIIRCTAWFKKFKRKKKTSKMKEQKLQAVKAWHMENPNKAQQINGIS
nr:acid-sensing ion channel 5-like [Ciona intestinalis]|eukprot:XP_009861518.1 acid-sensing ion channel 5-like [Ciona intestinalis]